MKKGMAVLLSTLLLACNCPIAPPAASVNGTWLLIHVDGDSLPADVLIPVAHGFSLAVHLLARVVTVADSTYREYNRSEWSTGEPWTFERAGILRREGGAWRVDLGGQPERGTYDSRRGEFVAIAGGRTWTYRRAP